MRQLVLFNIVSDEIGWYTGLWRKRVWYWHAGPLKGISGWRQGWSRTCDFDGSKRGPEKCWQFPKFLAWPGRSSRLLPHWFLVGERRSPPRHCGGQVLSLWTSVMTATVQSRQAVLGYVESATRKHCVSSTLTPDGDDPNCSKLQLQWEGLWKVGENWVLAVCNQLQEPARSVCRFYKMLLSQKRSTAWGLQCVDVWGGTVRLQRETVSWFNSTHQLWSRTLRLQRCEGQESSMCYQGRGLWPMIRMVRGWPYSEHLWFLHLWLWEAAKKMVIWLDLVTADEPAVYPEFLFDVVVVE